MPENFYVVGIGASAGGLEAFEAFIAHLAVNKQLALVLVRHLAPQHKSLSDKLLKKHTAYPIKAIEDGMLVEPGTLFVLTESRKIEIRNNRFCVAKEGLEKRKLYPIDYFFGSLAEAYGPRAIAVLLSGAGTDGSVGIDAIIKGGGRVLVQEPQEAGVDGMPKAALETGSVSFSGSVEALGKWLIEYVQAQNKANAKQPVAAGEQAPSHELAPIIHFLSDTTELDFKEYKTSTLYRRIYKRIGELQLQNPEEYLALLKEKPQETQLLKQSMLIGFTEFYRDKEAFDVVVEEVFPLLFERRGEEALRIWCAGCSTGEEAYTLAILLHDYMAQRGLQNPFTVFASDVNEEALKIAAEGRYVSLPDFLDRDKASRYFFEQGGYFFVRKEIRMKVVFTKHNLLKNPPFIQIDLLACRNVLIYMKPAAQKKLFMKFHFALRPGGFLFLGSNESGSAFKKLFEPFHKKGKIYINNVKQEKFSYISSYLDYKTSPATSVVSMKKKNQTDTPAHAPEYFERVLVEHLPPTLILNTSHEVVYTQGKVEDFIKFRGKQPSLQVMSLLDDTLKVIFRSGLRKLEHDVEEVVYTNVAFTTAAGPGMLSLRFQKTKGNTDEQPLILVQFFPQSATASLSRTAAAASAAGEELPAVSTELEELERELSFARMELQQTSDELELTNEKLQTANEELLSANEELQSMNEELQSANEELSTLNSELNESLQDLRQTHSDLSNLINAAEIGVIFLDQEFRIRKFTPLTKALFNIQEADAGRYLKDFNNSFGYVAFEEDAHKVLDRLVPVEKEMMDMHSGNTYLMRILPYRTPEGKVGGVVLLLVDISGLKKVQDQMLRLNDELKRKATELERAESSWRSLMRNLPDVVGRYDKNLNLLYMSDAFYRDTGTAVDYWIGKNAEDIAIEAVQDKGWIENMRKVLRTGEEISYTTSFTGDHGEHHYHIVLAPEFDKYGERVENVLVISRNITDLIKYENQLREKIAELEQKEIELTRINQYLDDFVYTAAHDLRSPVANLKLLLNLYDKAADKERVKKELDKSVAKLDYTLIGLVEVIEAQHSNSSVARLLHFEAVWARIVSDARAEIEAADAQLLVDFSHYPRIVYVAVFLESIFRNMLSNALKYRDGGRPLRLAVSTEPAEGGVLLKIKDNGKGMDLKLRGRDLFRPFSRLTHEGEGKGIGLHIVKNMIEKNGGRIEVDSEPNFGTSFYCYLREYSYSEGDSPG